MSKFFKLLQSNLCIDNPFEYVIYPNISSPGIGEQHLANLIKQLSNPSTIIEFSKDLDSLFLEDLTTSVSSFIYFLLYISKNLLITLTGDNVPNPIFS